MPSPETTTSTPPEEVAPAPETEQKTKQETHSDTEGFMTSLKEASDFPLPQTNPSWLVPLGDKGKKTRSLLAFLHKKEVSSERLQQLAQLSKVAAGKALVEVQNLLKQYPNSPDLYILAAICKQRNIAMSSASPKATLNGLKGATLDAAKALSSPGGLTIGNLDKFLQIYSVYFERLKRSLEKTKQLLRNLPQNRDRQAATEAFNQATQTYDYLIEQQKKAKLIYDFLKKIFSKSSQRNIRFEYHAVLEAVHAVMQGEVKNPVLYGSAQEVTDHVYYLLLCLAHIPLLEPLTEHYHSLYEQSHVSMQARWTAIQHRRVLHLYHQSLAQGKKEEIQKIARRLFDLNYTVVKKLSGNPLKKDFEFEAFLNLGRVTLLVFQYFPSDMQKKMFNMAQGALELCIKSDASAKGNKSQLAIDLTNLLNQSLQLDREKENDPPPTTETETSPT